MDRTLGLVGGVLVLLGAATAVVHVLRRRADSGIEPGHPARPSAAASAPGGSAAVLAAAFLIGQTATVVLFGLIAFWALREFITLTPTRPGDHRTLFWVFFLCTPLQFVLVGMQRVRALQHRDPGLRVPVHSRADRHVGRLQAVPGADGEDPGRAVDLRLLPELRPALLDARNSGRRGTKAKRPAATPGCCSSSSSWSSSATPCSTPGRRCPAGT